MDKLHVAKFYNMSICPQLADKKRVIMLVDAEYTSINPALNLLTLAMMLNYNKREAIVFYTYQHYLKVQCWICFLETVRHHIIRSESAKAR